MSRKWDFTLGIFIGVVLTVIGSLFQFELNRCQTVKMEERNMVIDISSSISSRLYRSKAVLKASGSSKFDDRWNDYIVNFLHPWNESLPTIYAYASIIYGEEGTERMNELMPLFTELHDELNEVRKKQGAQTEEGKASLRSHKLKADKLIQTIDEKSSFFTTTSFNRMESKLFGWF